MDRRDGSAGRAGHDGCGAIPAEDVIREFDRLLGQDRSREAEEFLYGWLKKAGEMADWRGELTLQNELMGFHRSSGKEALGLQAVREGIRLIQDHGMEETLTAGTTFLNAATTLKAFGRAEEAIPWYERAEKLYNRLLGEGDYRFAGLCNNLALAWTDLGQLERANLYYRRALEVLKGLPGSAMEQAVTWTNLACLEERRQADLDIREERIGFCLDRAMEYLDDPAAERDGYYAFTCRKCAPTFGYFGRFLAKRELEERAEEIYRRNAHERT